jgi:hypothetical protein
MVINCADNKPRQTDDERRLIFEGAELFQTLVDLFGRKLLFEGFAADVVIQHEKLLELMRRRAGASPFRFQIYDLARILLTPVIACNAFAARPNSATLQENTAVFKQLYASIRDAVNVVRVIESWK